MVPIDRPAVIGVGTWFRGDDAVGLRVAQRLRSTLPPSVDVLTSDGEAARLLDRWANRPVAVVVDAMRSGAAPGTTDRVEVGVDPLPAWTTGHGTHDLGLADAIALAEVLDRRPGRLVVVGVEGSAFDEGHGLSAAVALELDAITARVRDEVVGLAGDDHASADPADTADPADPAVVSSAKERAMCLHQFGQVTELDLGEQTAEVVVGTRHLPVSLLTLDAGTPVRVGDWLVLYQGFALEAVPADEYREVQAARAQLEHEVATATTATTTTTATTAGPRP